MWVLLSVLPTLAPFWIFGKNGTICIEKWPPLLDYQLCISKLSIFQFWSIVKCKIKVLGNFERQKSKFLGLFTLLKLPKSLFLHFWRANITILIISERPKFLAWSKVHPATGPKFDFWKTPIQLWVMLAIFLISILAKKKKKPVGNTDCVCLVVPVRSEH